MPQDQETTLETSPIDAIQTDNRSLGSRKARPNSFKWRDEWLAEAKERLAPMFEEAGAPLPPSGRMAIGFTSKGGGKSNCVGECWHSTASGDGHFEIFIRPDKSDPEEVLGILAHELVHAAVPLGSGHGKVYRDLAVKIGLEGKMRHAMPGSRLAKALKLVAEGLGPLPHASLNIDFKESAPRKKQKTNLLKAECPGGVNPETGEQEPSGYPARVTRKWVDEVGPPICPRHKVAMNVELPADDDSETGEIEGGEVGQGEALKRLSEPWPTLRERL